MFIVRDDDKLLAWIKKTFNLTNDLGGSAIQYFGPFNIRNQVRHVRYTAACDSWDLGHLADTSVQDHAERREAVLRLADKTRGKLPRSKFIRGLIREAIINGLTSRASILEAVDLAANREAIGEALDGTTGGRKTSPEGFSDRYIKGVLSRYQGASAGDNEWWVDGAKTYHLH